MKMRYKTFGENFILVNKFIRRKCNIKNLEKILYWGKTFEIKLSYKGFGGNFILGKKFLMRNKKQSISYQAHYGKMLQMQNAMKM